MRRILGLGRVEGQNAKPTSWRLVKALLRYGDFSIFEDDGYRHLGFSNV